MLHQEIAERIRRTREESGVSLTQLARKTDISKSVLSQYENGAVKAPSVIAIVEIANALDVSYSWLSLGSRMDHDKDDIEFEEYCTRCRNLPTKEKRFILEVMKRVEALNQVSHAVRPLMTNAVEDYSMS